MSQNQKGSQFLSYAKQRALAQMLEREFERAFQQLVSVQKRFTPAQRLALWSRLQLGYCRDCGAERGVRCACAEDTTIH